MVLAMEMKLVLVGRLVNCIRQDITLRRSRVEAAVTPLMMKRRHKGHKIGKDLLEVGSTWRWIEIKYCLSPPPTGNLDLVHVDYSFLVCR